MENFNEITDYLDPGRHQKEEWKGQRLFLINHKYGTAAVEMKEVENHKFKHNYVKKSIVDFKEDGTVFYIDESDDDSLIYYYEHISEDEFGDPVYEYERIRANVHYDKVTLTETYLESITRIFIDDVIRVYYSQFEEKMYVTILGAKAVSEAFTYSPQDLEPLEDGGRYLLDYVDHEGYGTGIWESGWKGILDGPVELLSDALDRETILNYHDKAGRVYWYPAINERLAGSHKFGLKYEYVKPGNRFQKFLFIEGAQIFKPIKLKFKTLESFLAFVKATFFAREGYKAIGTTGNKRRNEFNDELYEIVADEFRRREGDLEGLYRLFYYAPRSIIARIYNVKIWDFLELAVASTVTNAGTNRDDIVTELIKILAANTKKGTAGSDYFLDQLMVRKVEGECLLNLFAWRLDGVNFKSFLTDVLMPQWENSSYRIMGNITADAFADTDGPIMLAYKSDKTLGFFHSNCDVSYNEEKDRLKAVLDTGEHKELSDYTILDTVTALVTATTDLPTIDKTYHYHPYYPIIVPNHSDQKTTVEFKDVIPAIYLKMAEDGAFWENVVTAAEYALDIVTTFSGIGNVKKFSYLFKLADRARKLNRLSKTGSAVIAFKQVVRGTAAVVEISSGALNGLLKLTGVKDKYPELYASISEYLFYLECASLSGELSLGLRAALKKSARKTLDNSKGLNKQLAENSGDPFLFTARKNAEVAIQETYAAMIHLWEMAEIIARTTRALADNVKLALAELKVGIFEILDGNLLPKLGQLDLGDGRKIEILMMSGDMKVIFSGTKKQFDEFAKKVTAAANKGKEELTKLLNEAAEKAKQARVRKNALIRYRHKFDRGFYNHLDGEFNTKFFDRTMESGYKYVDEALAAQGGHRGSAIYDKKIGLIEIIDPPGLTKIDDVPDDLPFKAKVEIEYRDGYVPKEADSSMFPKNWSLERIEEEIALVYEKTFLTGEYKLPRKPDDLFDKYQYFDGTSQFKIIIEVDDLGQIVNSYPKL